MPAGSPPASQAGARCARGLHPAPAWPHEHQAHHTHVLMEPLLSAGQGPGGGGGRWTEQSTRGPGGGLSVQREMGEGFDNSGATCVW